MSDDRFTDIMDYLISKNYSVYAAGAHKGYITSPYIVVKPTSAQRYLQYSSVIQYYDIIYYGRTITEVISLQNKADEDMKGLRPMIVCTFNRSIPFFDESVDGYMVSSEYRNMKKISY